MPSWRRSQESNSNNSSTQSSTPSTPTNSTSQHKRRAPDQTAYHYDLAEAYRVSGRLTEAVERYRRAIALEPRIARAHFNLGNTLFDLGDILAAARSFRRARKLAPEDTGITLALSNALLELGDPETALELCQDAAQAADDPDALIGFGALAALYTGGYGGPDATPAELIAALVESSSGDILFFNRVSMPLSDLRDPESNKALVDLVLQGMHR